MQPTKGSKRLRLLERDEYGVDLEYNEDFLILHLPYVRKFNKGVYLEMLFSLEDFSAFFKTMGFSNLYAAVDKDNSKLQRLLIKLGFRHIGLNDGLNIYERCLS